jgi:hypothetical protein
MRHGSTALVLLLLAGLHGAAAAPANSRSDGNRREGSDSERDPLRERRALRPGGSESARPAREHDLRATRDLNFAHGNDGEGERGKLRQAAEKQPERQAQRRQRPSEATPGASREDVPITRAEREIYDGKVTDPKSGDKTKEDVVGTLVDHQRAALHEAAVAIDGKGGANDAGRQERDTAVKRLRGESHETGKGEHVDWQTCVYDGALHENAARYATMTARIRDFKPEAVFGVERGGAFVAEVVGAGDAGLRTKVETIAKSDSSNKQEKHNQNAESLRREIEARIKPGQENHFVIVDVYMGGGFANAVHSMLKDLVAKHDNVSVDTHWLRETIGLADSESTGGAPTMRNLEPRLREHMYPVRFALGDDAGQILAGKTSEALHLFNSGGVITQNVAPKAGETSRDVLVALLSGNRKP